MLVIELIDLAPVWLGESAPTPLLDEDPVAQAIGLLHFVAITMFVFGGYNVNHRHSPKLPSRSRGTVGKVGELMAAMDVGDAMGEDVTQPGMAVGIEVKAPSI
jgi:hypothetical protein